MLPSNLIKNITTNPNLDQPGIYMLYCSTDEKCYIGQARIPRRRLKRHRTELNCNVHCNIHMQRAYNKHGKQTFMFVLIENCPLDDLSKREAHYLNELEKDLVFNQRSIMEDEHSWRGNPCHTKESKEKLSKAHTGKTLSKEHVEQMRKSRIGKTRFVSPKERDLARQRGRIKPSLSPEKVKEIKIALLENTPIYQLANQYGVSKSVIHGIRNGKNYKYVIV